MLIRLSVAPKTKSPAPKTSSGPTVSRIVAGRASGKRRLFGLVDGDLDTKRKKLLERDEEENVPSPVLSHFFSNVAGPSRLRTTTEEDGVLGTQEIVLVADLDTDEVEDAEACDEEPDQVAQEDGYLSPGPSLKRLSTPDLSSPPRPLDPSRVFQHDSSTQDFPVDILSSPETRKPAVPLRSKSLSGRGNEPFGCILVPDTPRKSRSAHPVGGQGAHVLCSTQSSSSLEPPASQGVARAVAYNEVLDLEDDIEFIGVRRASQDAVARGWWSKWARGGVTEPSRGTAKDLNRHRVYTPLRRRETTVTPDGLHGALRFWPNANTANDKKAPTNRRTTREAGSARRSLIPSESEHKVEIIRRRRSTGTVESGTGTSMRVA
ncbi:hypothetical protein EDB85DRAFT_1331006 [Lactarius pseudohatsudake]|nr:hypothetical protein EDB85DRAFT_1331006 [Lactarius pseudohatsudake]